MATSLRWMPVSSNRSIPDYDFQLKNALRSEFGDGHRMLDKDALPFLRGLRAAGVKGAEFLMKRIDEAGEIEIWEES